MYCCTIRFDSYRTVEEFVAAGARDERVITMKQTLYRTSKDSPIFRALIEAGAKQRCDGGGGADGAL